MRGVMRGVMKPDVVFFGDVVRADVREAAERAVEGCSGAVGTCCLS
jgi:NAD-dependent SIR2 family protein deacetylase